MKVLALDVSTKTGWAVFDNSDGMPLIEQLTEYGLIKNPKGVLEYGKYPWCYLTAAVTMALQLVALAKEKKPDVIVIEETNKSRNRYSQKVLEYIHCSFLDRWTDTSVPVCYVNSSEWRKRLGLVMSKNDKVSNKKLKTAKKLSEATGKKLSKKELGIKGAITKKHLAVRYVNETFNLKLKIGENDIADAICLGNAYIVGAQICDGK